MTIYTLIREQNDVMSHMFSFCDHVTISELIFTSRRFRDLIDLYMSAQVNYLLKFGGSFHWKVLFKTNDIFLYIRNRDHHCNEEIQEDHTSSSSSATEEIIERRSIQECAVYGNLSQQDSERIDMDLIAGIGVDFTNREHFIKHTIEHFSDAIVQDRAERRLSDEAQYIKDQFIVNTTRNLMDRGKAGDSKEGDWEITLKCNETISTETAIEMFFRKFGKTNYSYGREYGEKVDPGYVMHKRHVALVIFNKAVSVRRSAFKIIDDTHAGFGTYFKKGDVFMVEFENGKHYEINGFRYFGGLYS